MTKTSKEKEELKRFEEMLMPQHVAIVDASKIFGISYSEAAQLLTNHHMNDMHAMMTLWFKSATNFTPDKK